MDLTIRPLRIEDAATMVAVLADPALYEATGGAPPTVDELARRYAAQVRGCSPSADEHWVNAIVLLDGVPIGYVQATIPAGGDSAEIAWVIGVPWQGRGCATRAGMLLLEELRARGVARVVAHVLPGHRASERVAAHLGLIPTSVVVDGEVRWEASLLG